jgi:lipoate-protein ligase A
MGLLPDVRQIIDPEPNSGAWNMAVDEVLLQSAIDLDLATLRFYRWREPTVSLGYFQKEEDVVSDGRLSQLPRVRRLSGGGTLVHDQELTYSLTLPGSQRLIERPVELYRIVHEVFIGVFGERNVHLTLRGTTTKLANEPVLCFAREDEHDLVLRGHKVLGSAQRRRRGAILQHGGLLLKASAVTPELLGISDLQPSTNLTGLSEQLGNSLLREVAVHSEPGMLSLAEVEAARKIAFGAG